MTLSVLPALASAADLIVGVVHDGDGYPVAGASISLRQTTGASAGTGRTAGDGTFAIDATAPAAEAQIRCAYCLAATAPVRAGKPVVVVVRRFAVLRDRGISIADARALPYATVSQMASLLPFAVNTHGTLSDRGLADARGAVVTDGIALYRATDGVDLGTAVPAHAIASILPADPTHANAYDARSAGGLFSIDTLDPSAGNLRVDASDGLDATLRAGNVLRGTLATTGGVYAASRAVAEATLPAPGGTLDLRALAAGGLGANAAGAAASYAVGFGASTLTADASVSRSADSNGPENDNVAALTFRHGGVTFGARVQRAAGIVGAASGSQYDVRAFAEAVHDDGRTRIFASLAGAQTGSAVTARAANAAALLPTLAISTRLAAAFSLHADSVDALLPLPLYLLAADPTGAAIDRSRLLDAGIGYDDANRIRIDAMVFRQTTTSAATGTLGGSGIAAVWQIAPSLALRSWVLISRANPVSESDYYPGAGGGIYPTSTTNLNRSIVWLTAGNVLRVDAISRGGTLEGDISVPAGPHALLVAGTRRDGPNRVYTLGLALP